MAVDENYEAIVKAIENLETGLGESLDNIAKALKKPEEETQSLAIISERRDRVKEKLEAGNLKADDAAKLGKEYEKLQKAHDNLIK